jgi:hypothetical protein
MSRLPMVPKVAGTNLSASRWPSLGVLALVLLGFGGPGAGRAQAQFGFGWGGLYNPNDGRQTQDYLNQRSLISGESAATNRGGAGFSGLSASSSANYYGNHVRDDSFFQKYDASTRLAIEDKAESHFYAQVARGSNGNTTNGNTTKPPAPTTPKYAVRLSNFFNSERKLVWPLEAPVTGDLGSKRKGADEAILHVTDEYQKHRSAPSSLVAEARRKLLDYGRPALQYVRQHSTPAIADSFHAFLLTLYTELGMAAKPSTAPPVP